MGSLFEKITLYDFFGYFIPGIFFVSLSYVCFGDMIPAEIAEMVGDKDMVLIGSILVFAYISGFVLSEISRWLDDKKSAKSMKNKRSEMIDSTVGAKVLKDAIKKKSHCGRNICFNFTLNERRPTYIAIPNLHK